MLHFFMATLSNISIISWSMNNSCILDVTICFGIVLCTGIFKNGITYPFTTDKISWPWVNFLQFLLKWANLPAHCKFGIFPVNTFFTKGWTFVRDSSGINSGHFLDKGARFWSRTLLTWDTPVPFVVLFPTVPYNLVFLFNVGPGILLCNVGEICTMLAQYLKQTVVIKKLTRSK